MNALVAQKAYLTVSGAIMALIGGYLMLDPVGFWNSYGEDLAGRTDLLSDIQGAGGALAVASLVVLAGAFVRALASPAILLSVVLYGGYAVGRTVSVATSGAPQATILAALAVEAVIAVLGLLTLRASRPLPSAATA
jgi:hypothetical protein